MKTQRLEDIRGEDRRKLEASYVRAHRKFFRNHRKIGGDDLVRFHQMFLKKKNITNGI